MNLRTATNEELRDWLAIRLGWTREGSSWVLKRPGKKTRMIVNDHPIPNTIDAADKCMPRGWKWDVSEDVWCAWEPHISVVETPRTTDEATDRFRLAALAIEAMEENK